MLVTNNNTWKSKGYVSDKDMYIWDTLLIQEGYTICKKNDQDSSYESALAIITSVLYDFEDALEVYSRSVLETGEIPEYFTVGSYTFSNISEIKNRIAYLQELSERCVTDPATFYVHRDRFGYSNLNLYAVELGTVTVWAVRFDSIRNKWGIYASREIAAIRLGDKVYVNERQVGILTPGCLRLSTIEEYYLINVSDLDNLLNSPALHWRTCRQCYRPFAIKDDDLKHLMETDSPLPKVCNRCVHKKQWESNDLS